MRALISVVARSLLIAAGCAAPFAEAQPTSGAQIYSCIDANGKRLTSDRPIVECNAREQRVLNADGSVKRLQAPPMTADERAEAEAREAAAASDRARQQEAIRRDRNLLARFPNEAAHRKAREQALEDVRKALRLSEQRLSTLTTERKPLKDESEFYVGKPLPLKLKLAIDANDASVDAQNSLAQNQRLEIVRVDKLYDAELERLKKLWAGAQPGSMGMIAGAASAPSTRR
jgi:ATPase subunit of ABC transporter with duplicated ATPase domains